MTPDVFGAAVSTLMMNPTAYKDIPSGQLKFMESMLTVILDCIKGELDARDRRPS